jgi:hypothetical protein
MTESLQSKSILLPGLRKVDGRRSTVNPNITSIIEMNDLICGLRAFAF